VAPSDLLTNSLVHIVSPMEMRHSPQKANKPTQVRVGRRGDPQTRRLGDSRLSQGKAHRKRSNVPVTAPLL
jgi:hypothetical protein